MRVDRGMSRPDQDGGARSVGLENRVLVQVLPPIFRTHRYASFGP